MSRELAKTYDPHGIEEKLYQKWLDKKYFHAEVDRSRKALHHRDAPRRTSRGSCIWDTPWTTPCRTS